MKYTVDKKKGQAVISIEIDADEFESAVEKAYNANKGKYSHPGFRKGHVPRRVLEGIYGKTLFHEDALNSVVVKCYGEVLDKETELYPVAQPEINVDAVENGGFKITATVTLKPEITLGKYTGLNVKRKEFKVKEKDITAELEKAAQKNSRMIKIEDRGIENGDEATFDFSGSVNGKKFEGGTAQNYKLEIGSGKFIPGFEEQMLGMESGGSKDVKVKFPEDYHEKTLAGKDAVFAVTVHEIHKKELPAIDDELAKDASDFETLKEWKADIKKSLEKSFAQREESTFENDIIEKIVAGTKVEIPVVMVEEQIDNYIEEFKTTLSYQGLKFEDYVKYTNATMEQIREDYRKKSDETVKTRLIMEQIMKQEKLFPTAKDIESKIKEIAEGSGKTQEEFKKTLGQDGLNYIMNDIASKKLIDFLKEKNRISIAEKTE